jgi:hypothetical protein
MLMIEGSTLSNIAINSQQYLFNRGRASNRALLKIAGEQENVGINPKRFPHGIALIWSILKQK